MAELLTRRRFLTLAAPAIVVAANIMPVRALSGWVESIDATDQWTFLTKGPVQLYSNGNFYAAIKSQGERGIYYDDAPTFKGAFRTIQEALRHASRGDLVLVGPGHQETIAGPAMSVPRGVKLISNRATLFLSGPSLSVRSLAGLE